MPNEKAPEPLSEEKLGSKKVCGVCGRERLNGLCRAKDSDRYCDTASADGYDTARCWRLGYERLAAILTPEVLRLIEAGRKVRPAWEEYVADGKAGAWWDAKDDLVAAARALPFEKPAEPNEDHDCVNASAVDALDFAPCSECEDQAKRRKTQLPKKGGE